MVKRKRKHPVVQVNRGSNHAALAVFASMLGRSALTNRIADQTYSGDRNVYDALGYPTTLSFDDYLGRYFSQDIAKAIIDRPVKASWKGDINVVENTKPKKTKFEKQWEKLYKDLKLKGVFIRADKLTGIGCYGVLLLGLDDVKKNEGFRRAIKKGSKLIYVKPFSEQSAVIAEYDKNPKSKRFGLPKFYKITSKNTTNTANTSVGRGNTAVTRTDTQELVVHYSRIVHITEDTLEDEVFGIPKLQSVYNRLIDLEKVVGGDAEMFWRGARPGVTGTVKDDYEMSDDEYDKLQAQVDDFEHHLKRVLISEGVDYKTLAQQIADPSNHVAVQIQMISAVTGIPARILIGSESGELASSQDKQEWISYVTSRREEVNEPEILRPFIDRLIEYNIIATPKKETYTIIWDKLFSLSDAEKVEVGKNRAIALKEYATNPAAQYMMPFEMFLKYYSALDETQISEIVNFRKARQEETGETELNLKEVAELNQLATRQMERTTEGDTRDKKKAA